MQPFFLTPLCYVPIQGKSLLVTFFQRINVFLSIFQPLQRNWGGKGLNERKVSLRFVSQMITISNYHCKKRSVDHLCLSVVFSGQVTFFLFPGAPQPTSGSPRIRRNCPDCKDVCKLCKRQQCLSCICFPSNCTCNFKCGSQFHLFSVTLRSAKSQNMKTQCH